MNNIIFYAIELVIAIIAFLVGKYVFPTVKDAISGSNIVGLATWVYKFVVSAKNQFGDNNGEKKLEYVTEQVKKLCEKYKIDLTDEQIRALIEDAYTQMKQNIASGKEA